MTYYSKTTEGAPRRPGLAERPRRDALTERLLHTTRHNLYEMADRSAPLPAGFTIEQLLDFYLRLRMCEHFDRWEGPGWEDRIQRSRY